MMWPFRSLLILSMMAASVVDLPEPGRTGNQDQSAGPLGQLGEDWQEGLTPETFAH